MLKTNVIRMTAVLALCAFSSLAEAPRGWFLAGSKPAEYQTDTDAGAAYNNQPSVFLKATTPVQGFGTLMQQFAATEYLGKRVRFSAFVKSENIQEWAGIWMRVDKGSEVVAFDNMQQRQIKGTTPWQRYEVVLDVPQNATGIAFGILLTGSGTAWINSGNFEVVSESVPVTSALPKKQTGPANLGFEK